MIDPHIKPKNDFTAATNHTAFENADILAAVCLGECMGQKATLVVAEREAIKAFTWAVNGAAMLQNFMNARIEKNGANNDTDR